MVLIIGAEKGVFDDMLRHAPMGASIAESPSISAARGLLGGDQDDYASATALLALDLELGLITRELRRGDRHKRLTDVQFWLMREVMQKPDQIVCPRFLLREVWGRGEDSSSQPLRQCVHLLRGILARIGSAATIHHCSGGYILTNGPARPACGGGVGNADNDQATSVRLKSVSGT